MRFCALASGSSGNCIYVGTGTTHILVDAGISCKRIEEALLSIDVDPDVISAVLITHDHSDHTQGAAVFCKRHKIPVYATAATLGFLEDRPSAAYSPEQLKEVRADSSFVIGDIEIEPYRISHDALDPVSYVLSSGGRKLGMATDLGVFTDYTVDKMTGSDALYIESNHDINMLLVGPYPYPLKQRIHSEFGHLSNDDAAELILKLRSKRLKQVVLAHVSQDNNFADLAYETVRVALEQDDRGYGMPGLAVADRYKPTAVFTV